MAVPIGQLLLPPLSGATVSLPARLRRWGPAAAAVMATRRDARELRPSFIAAVLDASSGNRRSAAASADARREALTGALVARHNDALPDVRVVAF